MPATNHRDLIFAHEGDARVGASIILAGMLAVLLGGTVMAIGPSLKHEPHVASNAGTVSSAPVRVVGTAPREQAGCDQQHDRQRDLRDHERVADALTASGAG